MFDYSRELAHRIGQFAGYLKKMNGRPCFSIFENRSPFRASNATLSIERAREWLLRDDKR